MTHTTFTAKDMELDPASIITWQEYLNACDMSLAEIGQELDAMGQREPTPGDVDRIDVLLAQLARYR